ncbi:MAG: UDP-N-acetylmuramoyl-tripeptide--D-alanyl-D-alanine ligase [Selenomonadaceae bacterium]|nr:UDP-N-acetylmuramoyl-tripeptide--D-alanyl-D-alanine ligase [Selenomonadaceae bacterium]
MTEFTRSEIESAIGAKQEGAVAEKFTDITTDTRKITPNSLFIALKGEKFNGEDFAFEAVEKGAAGVVVSLNCSKKLNEKGAIFKVPDTLSAYQKIAQAWRMRFDVPVIAITGSNGKTTTKELVAAALCPIGAIHKTAANFNNEVGLPLTLLGINEHHKAVVVEIGMRGLHQIENLAPIAAPNIGIVTNVGETHIELLGSIENIAKAKCELVEAIPAGGAVILNRDDKFVYDMRNKANDNVKVVTYGIHNDADVKAVDIGADGLNTKFKVVFGGKSYDYELPMAGEHNVYNALAAIAAGLYLGVSNEDMRKALSVATNAKMRFEVSEKDGVTFINDAYNASPLSMRAALSTLSKTYRGRKIALLGDMFELGKEEEAAHKKVGEEVAEFGIDVLITLGERAKLIAKGAKSKGVTNVTSVNTHIEAADALKEIIKRGDTVLIKGSRGMEMEKVLEFMKY